MSLIWCTGEKFGLQKLGVTKGFLYSKWCPNLILVTFLQNDCSPILLPCIEKEIFGLGHIKIESEFQEDILVSFFVQISSV